MSDSKSPHAGQPVHHVLPVVAWICGQVDRVYPRFVGPIASVLCQDTFAIWSGENDKRRADIGRYISMLAQHIPEIERRDTFIAEARKCAQDAVIVAKGATTVPQNPRTIDLDI